MNYSCSEERVSPKQLVIIIMVITRIIFDKPRTEVQTMTDCKLPELRSRDGHVDYQKLSPKTELLTTIARLKDWPEDYH